YDSPIIVGAFSGLNRTYSPGPGGARSMSRQIGPALGIGPEFAHQLVLVRLRLAQLERRRLVIDQVLELGAEFLNRQPGRGRELGQLAGVVEVVAPDPDHVAARDAVAG